MARTDERLWIRNFHPAPDAAVRLVCFPHAGGSASYFRSISAAVSGPAEVLAVQYPGRQDRRAEPMIDSLPRLADVLAGVIAGHVREPLALFGHSMGAILGFEVARRLEGRGLGLSALFASGCGAPSVPRGGQVHLEDDDTLLAEIARLDGTDAGLLADRQLMRLVLPAVRNDYRAIETYRYAPASDLSCPVTALIGDRDPRVSAAAARQWRRHTSGPFDLHVFNGGHFFLASQHEGVSRLLADQLRSSPRAGPGGRGQRAGGPSPADCAQPATGGGQDQLAPPPSCGRPPG